MLGLLATATLQDVQQARSVTAADLQDWHMQLFLTLAVLLELANRSGMQAEQCSAAAEGAAQKATQNSADPRQGHMQQTSSSTHFSVQQAPAARALTNSKDKPAEVSSLTAGLRTAAPSDAPWRAVVAAKKQLERYVDTAVHLLALMMLHNPYVAHSFLAADSVTKGQQALPLQHWIRVSGLPQCALQKMPVANLYGPGLHCITI
jgi:hypothetical protein